MLRVGGWGGGGGGGVEGVCVMEAGNWDQINYVEQDGTNNVSN